MKQVYLIRLTDADGDTTVFLVDQDTYNAKWL